MATALSNPEAETALVGLAMTSASAWDDAECEPGDFELPGARVAWQAIGELRAAGDEVTPLTVLDRVRTIRAGAIGAPELLEWAAAAVPGSAASTGAIVRSAATARRLAAACSEALDRLSRPAADAAEALAAHREAIAGIDLRDGESPVRLVDALPGVLSTIQARASKRETVAIPTGIKAFDDTIGGLRPKTQTVVAARPGQGKSSWAKGVAEAASGAGCPVLIFSLEMSVQEQAERMLGGVAEVNLGRITSGRLEYSEYVKLTGAASKLAELPIQIYDRALRVDRLESIARRWHARHVRGIAEMGLVICDYIGLVQGLSGANREREVASISAAGKRLAMALNVATIMVSQLNRDSEKEQRDPTLRDLRESGAIEQDADMIVFPVRDKENEDNRGSGPARLIVAKNRGGPCGEVPAWWEGRYTRYADRESAPVSEADGNDFDPVTGEFR